MGPFFSLRYRQSKEIFFQLTLTILFAGHVGNPLLSHLL